MTASQNYPRFLWTPLRLIHCGNYFSLIITRAGNAFVSGWLGHEEPIESNRRSSFTILVEFSKRGYRR